ncbi:MAG TPA: SPFH domain-containing protein, partial [Gammaproteobacteria bacterium]|nr:SPFH domain-containing protein [Gammaproteobacteria bacterium]
MNYRTPASLLVVILALVLLSQSLFIVPQGSFGVTRRIQSPLSVGLAPGLHYKLPFMDSVLDLDADGIVLDGGSVNGGNLKFATADGVTVQAGYLAVWRITDPATFCAVSACDEETVARRLNLVVVPALRDAFKNIKFDAALADQGRLTQGLAQALNPGVAAMGVHFEHIDLTDVTLSPAGLEDVYTRMRSAEEARAAEVRAEGAAAAARSHAATDAEREHILATADATAARLRAGGEADAAAIY